MLAFGPLEGVQGGDSAPNPVIPQTSTVGEQQSTSHTAPDNGPVNTKSLAQALKGKAEKSKKRRGRGMKPGAPATQITRGFQTPSSCGEASDVSTVSTPKMRPTSLSLQPSTSNSPSIRASSLTRAISELKLASSRPASDAGSPPSGPDSSENDLEAVTTCRLQIGSVDVPISRDFAAVDTSAQPLLAPVERGMSRHSPHRKMTAEDFESLKCLGKGTFGTVILVKQRSTGRLFAQKQLKKASITVQKHLIEQTKNERAILESVNRHPFVVKLYYAFQDRQKLYLILEYAQGGELFHHLAMERTFTEEVSAFYMAEMVLALDYLHRNLGVVYRDLKPENCLLDAEGHLLLTDFGLSKVALDEDGESRCNSILGTIDYMAPEVVQGKSYDSAVDWWSLGALGYDLLTGAPPFASNNHAKTEQKIVHGKLTIPYYLSADAKDILTRLLRKEPRKRLGGNMPKDLALIKSHRFFRRVDWRALESREAVAPIQPIVTDPEAAENFDVEFTDAAISPAAYRMGEEIAKDIGSPPIPSVSFADDTFGGFSYVASQSLLDCGLE